MPADEKPRSVSTNSERRHGLAADPNAPPPSEAERKASDAEARRQLEVSREGRGLNQPLERPAGVPQTEEDAREIDAEAVDKLFSKEEQADLRVGQGEHLEDMADAHVSGMDPNRALDLPPHMVTGDMKEDARRAYSAGADPNLRVGSRSHNNDDRLRGQAEKQPVEDDPQARSGKK